MICNIIENVFKQVKGHIVQKFTLATKRPITIIIKSIKIKKKEFANHIKIISQQKYVSKKIK